LTPLSFFPDAPLKRVSQPILPRPPSFSYRIVRAAGPERACANTWVQNMTDGFFGLTM
jgi:hypothetical protein